jgi:glycosyltransferase involved in cell wall biosynthesis
VVDVPEPFFYLMAVSIIIPCYNQAMFLGEAIESALKQTIPPTELIVVNDGSNDQTAEVAQAYPEVTYLWQENQGLCAARETGFKASSGEFVIFLDSDDRLPPDAIETGLETLETAPEAAFAFGRLQRISIHGTVIGARGEPARTNYYQDLLENNYIPTPGMVMFRRSCLDKYGLFNPEFPATADYDLYLRIVNHSPIVSHDHVTIQRRVHPDSMSRNSADMLRSVLLVHRRQWRTARRNRELRYSYAKGRRFWKNLYGRQLATKLKILRHQGAWPEYLRGLLILATFAPMLLPDALSSARVSNELEFSASSGSEVTDNTIQRAPGSSGADGPLVLIGLRQEPPDIYRHLRYLDEMEVLVIECSGARIGTTLAIGQALIDTVYVNSRQLLAYLPMETLAQSGKHRAHLLG